jgi:ABC-type multidrug transport system ATPase subunit
VGLMQDADKRISDFSKGMKSRLNFIKALFHDPKILILDEPTSGAMANRAVNGMLRKIGGVDL